MDSLKKILAVGSAVAMAALGVMPLAASATHSAGTNVVDSTGTVWNITSTGTRRAYTSGGAFTSYGFNTWGSVVPADAGDLALPVDSAGFIAPQDGTIFCATATKGSDVAGECSLVTGGQKASFTSQAVFQGLGFSFSNAVYGDSSFLTKTANVNSATQAHLSGTLINKNGTVYLVGAGGLLGIPDTATFYSWGYSFKNVVPSNAADATMNVTGVMATRVPSLDQFNPTALAPGNPGNPVVNGSVSASLASDTPAAGTLVSSSSATNGSQTGADIAHFAFSGTGTVTQVMVKRIGVSADTSINNVYLYMGNNRITDAGTFSQGMVTFSNSNGLFTVNGSAEVSVRVDVGTNISGQTIGAQLASYTVANGAPMSTTISGNVFTLATVTNLATVKLSVTSGNTTITGAGANGGTNGTINAGTMNANLWGTTVTVGQRTVKMQYIQFKQIGSISASAIQNLKLMVDGSQVGSTASITNSGANTNVVIFDLTGAPVSLNTGSHTIELHGDVVTGTSYNYNFTLQTSTDALFWDTSYGVNVPLTYSGGSSIFQLTPGTTTVNSGTISVQSDPTFTATQFVKNASQVTLGQWTMKAYGEDVKVQNLAVVLHYLQSNGSGVASTTLTSGDGFNNLAVYVNGGQVGASVNALNPTLSSGTAATSTFGTTNLFTVPAGTTVTVAIKGDSVLSSTGNSSFVNSVRADLNTPQNSLQGVTSFTLSPTGAAGTTYSGIALTTGTSTATISKNTAYANQSVGPNQTRQKIGSFVIQASNADGVRVSSLSVALSSSTPASGNVFTGTTPTGLANLILVTPDFPNGTTPVSPSASNSFSVNFTVAANQTATVDVYADVSNVSGNVIATMSGSGIGTGSSQAVTLSGSGIGQTITIGSGTLGTTPTLDGSSPVATFVIAGAQNQAAATFNFVATTGSLTIQQLDFEVVSSSGTPVAVTSVSVGTPTINGVAQTGGSISNVPMNGATSTVTGLNIVVPTSYGGVNVPVTMDLSNVGVGGIASNQIYTLDLTHVKFISGGTTTDNYYMVPSNSFNLVGSAPTVTLAAAPAGTKLTAATVIIGQVTVSANAAGNVVLDNLPVSLSANNASVTVNTILAVDSVTGVTANGSSVNGAINTNGTATSTIAFTTDNNIAAGTSKTYNIEVTVSAVGNSTNGNPSVSFGLGNATLLTFKDINGNADNLPGKVGSITYLSNYPVNTVSIAP